MEVQDRVNDLLEKYNSLETVSIYDLIDFHYEFERIHPLQDGNGRVGRLILFKECLKKDIWPLIIDEFYKVFYYKGLNKYHNEKGYLRDTLLSAQDKYKEVLIRLGHYHDK